MQFEILDEISAIETFATGSAIREIARSGHIDLCEGFAERICTACLADPRVERVRVWVEKLDVFPDAEGVGAILERTRPVEIGRS